MKESSELGLCASVVRKKTPEGLAIVRGPEVSSQLLRIELGLNLPLLGGKIKVKSIIG